MDLSLTQATTKRFLKQALFTDFIEKRLTGMGVDKYIVEKIILKIKSELDV